MAVPSFICYIHLSKWGVAVVLYAVLADSDILALACGLSA